MMTLLTDFFINQEFRSCKGFNNHLQLYATKRVYALPRRCNKVGKNNLKLRALYNYCTENNLTVNIDKT